MTEKENTSITSLFSLEEKKLYKKYIEEYNDLFQKILLLSPSEFITKLTELVEYSLHNKSNKYSKSSKDKIKELITEKIYKNDYNTVIKIKSKLIIEKNKEYFSGEILSHCDKDKKDGFYIHSCNEKFLLFKNEKNIFLFCEKCNMIYKENLIKFKCPENNIDFYSKIIQDNNKNTEENLPYATWAKYHCNAVINDLMKCQKCSNNLFLLKKKYKNMEKKHLYCKKCKKSWHPLFLQWECLICKKLFTCDAKAYNPLEFKTIKICIKEAIVNKIRAVPDFLDCDCNFNFSEIHFFHKASCRGELYFGELNGKKTIVCEKCDSIGFNDGYIWTCPLCLKKTKKINNNKNSENKNEVESNLNDKNKVENKSLKNDENNKIKKDNISMSKINIRNKYKMLNKFHLTDNLSTNNIKNNVNKNILITDIKEDLLKEKEIDKIKDNGNETIKSKSNLGLKHEFSFSRIQKDFNKNNDLSNEDNKEYIDSNYFQKIKKYLSVLDTDNTYIKDIKNDIDKNIDTKKYTKIKSSVLNIYSRNNNKSNLKPSLTSNEVIVNNKYDENIKRKDSFMSKFNRYKISAKLSRVASGKNIDKDYNNNGSKIQNNKDLNISSDITKKEQKNLKNNQILFRYKNAINLGSKIGRNYKNNLDINISKDYKTEINSSNNKVNIINKNNEKDQEKEKEKEKNIDNYYNNKKGSNSTADNSDNATKIIYHVKNPKQSFQIKKNKSTINLENYKIIRKIGQGSFGQIFEIEDNLKNKYALKKIIVTQESDIKKIEHEYQILIDLNSLKKNLNLNLIKIYGFSSKQLDPTTYVIYVLMELAITDWEKEIINMQKSRTYYTEQKLMKILSSLVKTFSQLQKNNVSHRDIKPQNILIFENDIYKLADFGEAKELYKDLEATYKQTLRGTELYMAPVLFHALRSKKMIKYIKHNTYKSDVFSFGLCSLFAATLSFESVYDVREAKNNVSIKFILEKYLSKRYSFDTINIISQMLDINETTRKDFIELEKEFAAIGYK